VIAAAHRWAGLVIPALAGGRVVAARWIAVMRAAVVPWVLLTGCFIADQVNQRPSIDIRQKSGAEVYRNSTVELEAVANDPEGQVVFFQWRAYACTDATPTSTGARPGCDQVPFHTEVLKATNFVVPVKRTDADVPPQVVLVFLEAQDEYGAIARPIQQLLIPIANHAPGLELSMRARYGYVVGTPIELYAKVSDSDDGAATALPLEWTVYTPMNQPAYDLVEIDVADPEAPAFLQLGQKLTPKGVGDWEVQVTSTDPLGAMTMQSLMIPVKADGPPCLSQWAPIAAPSGSAWPMTEPTLFQVSVVEDELDPYPTVPGDAELGTTTFAWSIKEPGAGSRTALAATGNSAALDPSHYQVGDIVELRVEIADRNATPVNCTDANATCSVISTSCNQRLTWRVEVR
jgi:hypothetical protein